MWTNPDKAAEELEAVAPVLGRYREALLREGFNRQEALELCVAMQTAMVFGEAEQGGTSEFNDTWECHGRDDELHTPVNFVLAADSCPLCGLTKEEARASQAAG